jgi:hypothetical protein
VQKEITMQSVFFEGFKAAYRNVFMDRLEGPMTVEDDVDKPLQENWYFEERNKAWLDYVKDIERG